MDADRVCSLGKSMLSLFLAESSLPAFVVDLRMNPPSSPPLPTILSHSASPSLSRPLLTPCGSRPHVQSSPAPQIAAIAAHPNITALPSPPNPKNSPNNPQNSPKIPQKTLSNQTDLSLLPSFENATSSP